MPRTLIHNRVRTAQVLLLVVVILGALYVMDAVVGSGLIRRPYEVTVNLAGSGVRIPVDTRAVVSNLSAVGEQRLDFRPRVDHGPWLEPGSVVAEKDTGLPLATSTLFLHTKTLTDQIDVNDVRTISR